MKTKMVRIMIAVSMLLLLPIAVYAADMVRQGFSAGDPNRFTMMEANPFGVPLSGERRSEKVENRTGQADDRHLAKILLNAAKPAAVTAIAGAGEKPDAQEELLFHRLQALRASSTEETTAFNFPAEVLYGSIAGRVTNAGDAGIENVVVYILSTDGNSVTNTYTDADGYYAAGGIPTGSYKVYFYGNNTGYVSEWYNDKGYIPDGENFYDADIVTVSAPGTTTIDAVLAQGGSITGRVTNAGGAGIQDVEVDIYTSDGYGVIYVYTDADGYYTAVGIPTGSFKVYFYGGHLGYANEWYNDKQVFDSADIITCPGTTSGIDAVLAQGGSITGRVTNAGGVGIQDVEVDIYTSDGYGVIYVYTDADGYYTAVGLLASSYKVYFYGNNTDYVSEWYNDKQDLSSADTIAVTAPGTTTGIDAVLGLPSLTLTSPNGGESWQRNALRVIRWNASAGLGNLRISLWQNTTQIGIIADDVNPAAGSYVWSVGAYSGGVAPLGTGYTIRIREKGTDVSDASDAPFSIVKISVKAPNGGESWPLGSTQNITWVTKEISGQLRIVLFKDGVKVGNIVNSIDPALGTYSWTVGQLVSGAAAAGTGYQVQIREIGTDAGDRSDANFTLTSP
jgi:hypothetical protein